MSIINSNKKITIVSIGYGRHLFVSGNTERLRMEACARGTKTCHILVFCSQHDNLSVQQHESGLVLHPISANLSILKIFKAIIKVRELVRNSSGKVIVTTQDPFETGLIGWIATRFSKAGLNVQEHGDVFGASFWRKESFLNQVRFYIGLFVLKQSDSIRVVSKRIVRSLSQYNIPNGKIKLLSVLTDPKPFQLAKPSNSIRKMFPAGSFVFLNAGRFVDQKNINLLLTAFYQAAAHHPDLRLLLIGSGPKEREIKNIVKEENDKTGLELVKIIDWVDNLPEIMASVDAYVLSSNYEGWGRVLLEARYAKLPMVTTDVGCVGEEIIGGQHGLVVPINDEKALRGAILAMATDSAKYENFKRNLSIAPLPEITSYEDYAKAWLSTFEKVS